MNLTAVLSVSIILFSVIDIIGNIPILVNLKREGVNINALLATTCAALIMIVFLFFGTAMLQMFGIEVSSFAMAGALILFFIGLEMILGIRFFRDQHEAGGSGSIVPIAFPLLAGAGTLTTILSLKAEYDDYSILSGIAINLFFIFIVLKSTGWISKKMSPQVAVSLRKFFGIILIAIAIQMVRDNI